MDFHISIFLTRWWVIAIALTRRKWLLRVAQHLQVAKVVLPVQLQMKPESIDETPSTATDIGEKRKTDEKSRSKVKRKRRDVKDGGIAPE